MAPEQAGGKSKELGPACDIYALGAMLYECLTGRPPFRAATPLDTVLQVVSDEPVPLTQLNGKVPRDLETICLKCLHKEAGKRYRRAADLAEDFRRFQTGEAIEARPVGRLERTNNWVRRHKGLSAVLAAAVLALVAGTAVALWQALVASSAAANEARQREVAVAEKLAAEAARKTAEEQKTAAELARKDAQEALLRAQKELFRFESMHYIDHIVAADNALHNNDLIAARWHLEECRPKFRHVEHAYLSKQLAQKGPRQLLGHTSAVHRLALSSDGKRLFSGSGDLQSGDIKVWDVEAGKEIRTLRGHSAPVKGLVLSPDGKRVFSGSADKTIKVWDLEAGKQTLTLPGHGGAVNSLALSPDGKRLFSGSADKTIKVWNLDAGK
jgi:hypothetical protein